MYFCSFGIRLSVKPSRSQILSDQEFRKSLLRGWRRSSCACREMSHYPWAKSFSTSRRFLVFSNLFQTLKQPQGLPRTGTIPNLTRGLPPQRRIRDVDKVIAVASAKGGVGKSTIAGITV